MRSSNPHVDHVVNAPAYLVPKLGDLPVSSARIYQTVTLTKLLPVQVPEEGEGALEADPDAAKENVVSAVTGVAARQGAPLPMLDLIPVAPRPAEDNDGVGEQAAAPDPDVEPQETVVTAPDVGPAPEQSRELRGPQRMTELRPPSELGALRPAEGVILTHEQAWRVKGVALGRLLNTVCLAPGEITQVAIMRRERTSRGQATDTSSRSETLDHTESQDSTLTEVQNAVASEIEEGRSTATSASNTTEGGIGGIAGGFGFSVSGAFSGSVSTNVSHSQGQRNVSQQANQGVHQAALQQARMARSQSRTAVREVSEHERTELRARVVANYNHMHALTVEYFEVVQVYELSTRVTRARRCIFLPMEARDFSHDRGDKGGPDFKAEAAILRYADALSRAARALGDPALARALSMVRLSGDVRAREKTRVSALKVRLAGLLKTVESELNGAQESWDATTLALLKAKEKIRKLKDGALVARAKLEKELARLGRALTDARDRVSELAQKRDELRAGLDECRLYLEEIDEALKLSADEIVARLNAQALEYNHAIWGSLDPTQLAALLANRRVWVKGKVRVKGKGKGRKKAAERWEVRSVPLGSTVDPVPVAVTGHYLALPWKPGFPESEKVFEDQHLGEVAQPATQVALPTDGVFAEAVLGVSKAAEKIDTTRFWNWQDALPPIRPTEIEALRQPDVVNARAPELGAAPPSHLTLNPLQYADVSSLSPEALEVLAKQGLFGDASGQSVTAKLAKAATELSAHTAKVAGRIATENLKRYLQLQRNFAATANAHARGADPTQMGGAMNAAAGGQSISARPNRPDGKATDELEEFMLTYIPGETPEGSDEDSATPESAETGEEEMES